MKALRDDSNVTPITRPTRVFGELTQLRRRVVRCEFLVTIALAMAIGLCCGLLAYVARMLAERP